MKNMGRLTIPTDLDIVGETIEVAKKWGADAVRDADGVELPPSIAADLQKAGIGAKIYATYYTTRKDNAWAAAHPEEVQQCYIVTPRKTAFPSGADFSIKLLDGISGDLLKVNTRDDIKRWWEVIDRTTGEVVPASDWRYDESVGSVIIKNAQSYHEYTAAFLCYIIWDPVHMYNAVVNNWENFERQCTFDVRLPATREWSKTRLRAFLKNRPHVNVVRFTTFFHQFTLIFDELRREKYVDWYGYSASVSPYILEKFEKEAGYPFRAEFIVDEGYYNNQYRAPSREFRDFMAFQRRKVASLAKELVSICHEEGREAMMFLGDHWIGTEPYCAEFAGIGLDAVVGSVGNGQTLRLLSDIKGVKYTEGRFLPYFFPDTFKKGGEPTKEARANWLSARRAILRSPLDRIGYGGYLKLALDFPDFVDYIEKLAGEFREIYDNVGGKKAFCVKRVAVLNAWGACRAWGAHMVHHALYHKKNYGYAGVIEALSGLPLDVQFISFDDILDTDGGVLRGVDVVLNIGDALTAHSGGDYWGDPRVVTALSRFIAEGGGFIGVGEPSAYQKNGRFFQMGAALGVEIETGFTLGYDKYNWDVHPHFITENLAANLDFGEGKKYVYALPHGKILASIEKNVQLAVSDYGKGRSVYISSLPYTLPNSRLLYRALLWAAHGEEAARLWYADNPACEVNVYPETGKYCIVNNSPDPQSTLFYDGAGKERTVRLEGAGIEWAH